MAIGWARALDNFAGGVESGFDKAQRLQLLQNADERAQEQHEEDMKKAANEWRNLAEDRSAYGDQAHQNVYTGTDFPGQGYPTADAAAGITPSAPSSTPATPGLDRSRFAQELAQKPWLRNHIMAVAAGENNDPTSNQAVLESMMNRADMMGTTLEQESRLAPNGGYYAGYNPAALGNPNTRAMIEKNLSSVLGGSNVSNYATDNSSGAFAQGRAANGMYTPTLAKPLNGEYFTVPTRSDARGYDRYGDWLRAKMSAAQAQPQASATPGQQTATADTGTATDAVPAGAPPQVASATPQDAGAAQPTPTAPPKGALGPDEAVVYDSQGHQYFRVPKSQTRPKNILERATDDYSRLMAQGKPEIAAQVLHTAAQTAVIKSNLDQDELNKELSRGVMAGPEAFSKVVSNAANKLGMGMSVEPVTVTGPDGTKAVVLKVNQHGTIGPAMYYDRNGQMTPNPDPSPEAYTAGVQAVLAGFKADIPGMLETIAKTRAGVQQAAIAASQERRAQEAFPLEQAAKQSTIQHQGAQAKYWESEANTATARVRQQALDNYNKTLLAMKENGLIPKDPDEQARVIADLKRGYGIPSDVDYEKWQQGGSAIPTTQGGAPAAPAPAAPAPAALPAGLTSKSTQVTQAGIPQAQPAGPDEAPAPYDDSVFGKVGRSVHSALQARRDRIDQADRQYAEQLWNGGETGHAYNNVHEALTKRQAPNASDVSSIDRSLKSWPWLADKMHPDVVKYVKKYSK
jgi:hypothetical protein